MTELVLGLTQIVGVISTIYYFFNADEYGWGAFFACIVATAVLSLLIKIYEMCTASLNLLGTMHERLNNIENQRH